MRSIGRVLLLSLASLCLMGSAAQAGGVLLGQPGAVLALSCENGHVYPLHPRAVSGIDGDLVTLYLMRFHGRGIHMRLVPMGFGYRYAGPGIWFDGLRGAAWLYIHKYHPVACQVVAA